MPERPSGSSVAAEPLLQRSTAQSCAPFAEESMNASMVLSRLVVPAALALAAGCASLPPENGRPRVTALVAEHGRDASAPADAGALVSELLAQPLSAEGAVRIALVSSPGLRSEYARLGIASADVYDAGRLANPTLAAALLDSNRSGAVSQRTFGIAQSFTSLILLSARSRLAAGELQRAQQSVAGAVLDLAAQVERGWYALVAAQDVAAMRATIADAARVSAELTQRFFDAGNVTRREVALAQAAATQARIDGLDAQAEVARASAALDELMGLGAGATGWRVTSRLPAPYAEEDDLDALLALADRSRLDLAAARGQTELLADALGVTRRFRVLGEAQLGVEQERDSDHERLTGPTLSWELPIFGRNAGGITRAQAQLDRAEAEAEALQVEIVSALRLAHSSVLNAKARAREYREGLIPQREEVVERTQERVSFMLEGQFELLLAKQQEYEAYQGYIEAVRDYWLARTDLARAVGTMLPSSAQQPQPQDRGDRP
jgi:cobalt-zinc-cadmium efflux system outer membrane protein